MTKRVIIVGCGISGAAAAQEFKEAGYEVVILEKENRLGGKIKTLRDLNAEIGAVVFFNHYPVVDTVIQKNLSVENVFSTDEKSFNQILYGKENPSLREKINFSIQFMAELAKYTKIIKTFDEKNDTRSFYAYLKDHDLLHLARFFEFWIPGMGYGPLEVIPAYRALKYSVLKPFNVFAMTTGLFGQAIKHVHGGFQQIVEKMVEGYDVRTSVDIKKITRTNQGSFVTFSQKNANTETLHADLLVLTMSPYHWPQLAMVLTDLEKRCVSELNYVCYPVAVCDIKGFPPKNHIEPNALKKAGLGHVALIHTNDHREFPDLDKGRRCVVYINCNDRQFSLDEGSPGRQILLDDLRKLGYPDVTIRATEVWKDYNPSLPRETSEQLECAQGTNCTLYLGSYSRGYETVVDAENNARGICRNHLDKPNETYLGESIIAAKRACQFFWALSKTVKKKTEFNSHFQRRAKL